MMPSLSIILPTFNEVENIPIILSRLESTLKDIKHEIIVVDDNSPDLSWKIAQDIADRHKNIKVLRRMKNHGLSQSVVDGFKMAQGQFYFVMDADLQHDEQIIPQMYEKIKNNHLDLVVASRKSDGGTTKNWSYYRRFISFVASYIAYFVIPKNVTDPMSGFFAIAAKSYCNIEDKINPKGFKILLEILVHLKSPKVQEVGYIFQNRQHGKSKLSSKVIGDYLVAIYDLSIGRYITRPFVSYCLVGSSGVLVNQTALFILKYYLALKDSLALGLAIEISMLTNFFLNHFWTFYDKVNNRFTILIKKLFLFHLVCAGGFIINYSVAFQMTRSYGMEILVSNLFGILLATIWNFTINTKITWKHS